MACGTGLGSFLAGAWALAVTAARIAALRAMQNPAHLRLTASSSFGVKREHLAVPVDAKSRGFVSLFHQVCNALETDEICNVALLLVQFANNGAETAY
jgi:hypothetical protein